MIFVGFEILVVTHGLISITQVYRVSFAQRSQSQRRSEGCLDLAGFGNPGQTHGLISIAQVYWVSFAQRSQSQRRSEGCLDLAGFGNPGCNTWPNQHHSSIPGKFCSKKPVSEKI